MTNQNDARDPYWSHSTDAEMRSPASLDTELQPDAELAEGRSSGGRMIVFAIAVAAILVDRPHHGVASLHPLGGRQR